MFVQAKLKYETLTEEWERAILQKAADPSAQKKTMTKGMTMSIFRQPKSVGQVSCYCISNEDFLCGVLTAQLT